MARRTRETGLAARIRELLRSSKHPLTTDAIRTAMRSGIKPPSITAALRCMPDAKLIPGGLWTLTTGASTPDRVLVKKSPRPRKSNTEP